MKKTIAVLLVLLFTIATTQAQSKSKKPTIIYSYVYFELINNLGMPFENVYEHIDRYWKITKHKKNAITLKLRGKKSKLPYGQFYYPYIEIVLKKGICTEVHFYGNSFNVFDAKPKSNHTKLAVKRPHLFIPDLSSAVFADLKLQNKYTYKAWNSIGRKETKKDNAYYYVPYMDLRKGTPSNQQVEIIATRKRGMWGQGRFYSTSVFLTVDGKNKKLKKMKRKYNFD